MQFVGGHRTQSRDGSSYARRRRNAQHAGEARRRLLQKNIRRLQGPRRPYFFYIGGNDSAETCRIVNKFALAEGYELRVIHIPQDHRQRPESNGPLPGIRLRCQICGSGINGGQSGQPIVTGSVRRGRHGPTRGLPHSGSSVFARKYDDDGPHLIYVPEALQQRRVLGGRRGYVRQVRAGCDCRIRRHTGRKRDPSRSRPGGQGGTGILMAIFSFPVHLAGDALTGWSA